MTDYRMINKDVADSWLQRYKKEMSEEEFKTWAEEFDKSTVVYTYVTDVEFLTKDYIKCKLEAERNK